MVVMNLDQSERHSKARLYFQHIEALVLYKNAVNKALLSYRNAPINSIDLHCFNAQLRPTTVGNRLFLGGSFGLEACAAGHLAICATC